MDGSFIVSEGNTGERIFAGYALMELYGSEKFFSHHRYCLAWVSNKD
jgi:hypothetical protein